MTARAPAWFEQKYVQGATHVLQTEGYLTQGMTAPPVSQKGNIFNWKIAGKGEATEMSGSIENRPTMNTNRTTVSATIRDWEANEWIQVTDLTKMSEGEIQIAQQSCAYAMGRRFDRILFDELNANAPVTAMPGTANLTLTDIIDAQASLLAQGVNGDRRIIVGLPYKQLGALGVFQRFANADYVTDRPLLKKIGARNFMGMEFVPFPDEYFPEPAANQVDFFMWMPSCVGFATNTDAKGKIAMATRIDYVPEKKAYLAANTMSACARVILPEGIRRLRTATNVAIGAGAI